MRVAAYCRVSTDSDEQINSYNAQVIHYKDLIKQNKEWDFVDIYADSGISGTPSDNRDEFQRMISDATKGLIDVIITKSISRFARNTMDTLKYVRQLKDENVAIIKDGFENEAETGRDRMKKKQKSFVIYLNATSVVQVVL